MSCLFDPIIRKRHGDNVYIMSQSDWENARKAIKAESPELYEMLKEKMNFPITPVEFDR